MISLLHCLVWEFLVFALVRFCVLITFQIRSFFFPFFMFKIATTDCPFAFDESICFPILSRKRIKI